MVDDSEKRAIAAAWLERVSHLSSSIESIEMSIEQLRKFARPLEGCGAEVASTRRKLQGMVDYYMVEIERLERERGAADIAIKKALEPTYADVMARHYLRGQKWDKVARDVGYTFSGLMSLRKRCLPKVYDAMPPEYVKETENRRKAS